MSEARPAVLLALTPIAERAIESLIFGPEAPLELTGSAAEADELERLVGEGRAEAALISPGLSGLTQGHCARARASGTRLLGLALDQREEAELGALGVDQVLDASVSAEGLAAALRGEEGERRAPAPPPSPREPANGAGGGGSAIAVLGSKGAPGASECAASLASLAAARWATVLVELDALGGGLDLRLGADPRAGSILGLARAAQLGEGGVGELLERWLASAEGWPQVLLGPPDLGRALGELAHPGALAACLRALRPLWPLIVCDVGFLLQEAEGAGPAERAHREAIVSADAVILILGVREAQLRHGLAQLALLLDGLGVAPDRLRVVANGLGGPGAASRHELAEALPRRLAERGIALDAWLPWDGRALGRSRRTGAPLAVARPRGPYARALRGLIGELFLPTAAPAPRQRKRRLAAPRAGPEAGQEVALRWRS